MGFIGGGGNITITTGLLPQHLLSIVNIRQFKGLLYLIFYACQRPNTPYIGDGYGAFRQPKFYCDCCEMLVLVVCGSRHNCPEFCLYSNADLDDRILACLLTSMAAVQAESTQWLGSTTTNRHGVAAFDFAAVSGCDQFVVGPTHARGGTLD